MDYDDMGFDDEDNMSNKYFDSDEGENEDENDNSKTEGKDDEKDDGKEKKKTGMCQQFLLAGEQVNKFAVFVVTCRQTKESNCPPSCKEPSA